MKLLDEFFNLILTDKSDKKSKKENEDYNKYRISYKFKDYNIPKIDELKGLFRELKLETKHTGDNINLQFDLINEENPINNKEEFWLIGSDDSIQEQEEQLIQFIESLTRYSPFIKDVFYKFGIEIIITRPPKSKNNIRRIYSFDIFKEKLKSKELSFFITKLFQDTNSLKFNPKSKEYIFIIDEKHKEFFTHNILFIHDPEEIRIKNKKMDTTEENIYDHLSFYNNNFIFKDKNLNITPYSFRLLEESECEEINKIFNNLVQYTALIYLSDKSNIDNNILSSNIKGYTLLQIECMYPKDDLSETALFEIYKWIYKGDKKEAQLEIAKNIISLEFKENIMDINKNVLESIKSNYIIYSIDNVERYIDIKSNIIRSVSEITSTFSKSINYLTSRLKNLLGLNITFFLSIIIFNLIENNTKNFFTFDIAVVSIFILIGSLLFFLLNIKITVIDLYKHHNKIINIKDSYNNLITDNDIKNTIKKFYTEETFKELQSEILYHFNIGIISLLFILFGVYMLTPDIKNYFNKGELYVFIFIISIVLIVILLTKFIKNRIIYKHEFTEDEKIKIKYGIFK